MCLEVAPEVNTRAAAMIYVVCAKFAECQLWKVALLHTRLCCGELASTPLRMGKPVGSWWLYICHLRIITEGTTTLGRFCPTLSAASVVAILRKEFWLMKAFKSMYPTFFYNASCKPWILTRFPSTYLIFHFRCNRRPLFIPQFLLLFTNASCLTF